MPLYVYEHDAEPSSPCDVRFEVLQGADDPPLKKCPECDGACHRVITPFATMRSVKDTLSPKNLGQHGFTQYKKAGGGYYEKTCGDGPNVISRD